jgi:asparagine synthase (glutamine-hydrolysing)
MDELTSQKVLARRGLFNPASVARLRAAFDAQQGDVAFTLLSVMSVELWCRGLEARPALAQVEARKAA